MERIKQRAAAALQSSEHGDLAFPVDRTQRIHHRLWRTAEKEPVSSSGNERREARARLDLSHEACEGGPHLLDGDAQGRHVVPVDGREQRVAASRQRE
jgi:hypothetical protein